MNERDTELALKCRLIAAHTGGIYADSLQAFADLIRADEREACMKICKENFYAHLAYEDILARGSNV